MFREIGYADELGSGMRNTNKYTKLYSGGTPSFIEDDVFRISIPIDNVANLKVGGNENLIQKNERSLSEVLSEVLSVKDFEKCGIYNKQCKKRKFKTRKKLSWSFEIRYGTDNSFRSRRSLCDE